MLINFINAIPIYPHFLGRIIHEHQGEKVSKNCIQIAQLLESNLFKTKQSLTQKS